MFKLSFLVTIATNLSLLVTIIAAAEWHDSPGGVKNQIDATRATTLANEWMNSCKTRPVALQQDCRGQCVTALSIAGCESEWDSLARKPDGCEGGCIGILQMGCQWLTPKYACKDLAAQVFTDKGFDTCDGATQPFTGPELDSAVMQVSQCLLENVTDTPYSSAAWKNQWTCASMKSDPHYKKAKKLAQTACQQASQRYFFDRIQYV